MREMHMYAERLGDEKILYSTLLYSILLYSTLPTLLYSTLLNGSFIYTVQRYPRSDSDSHEEALPVP